MQHWNVDNIPQGRQIIDEACGDPDIPDSSPEATPSAFLPMRMKANTKMSDTFLAAGFRIIQKVESSSDVLDRLSWLIQETHAAPMGRAHTYVYKATGLNVPSPAGQGAPSGGGRQNVPDGWLQVSQQGQGTFSPLNPDAPLVKGCHGILASTINNKPSRYRNGHAERDPELEDRGKVLVGRLFQPAKIIADGPIDRNRIYKEQVEYTGQYKLVHGAADCAVRPALA